MALETPNQVHASAVLLIDNYDDPPNSTVEFAASNGFASVNFLDLDDPDIGLTLEMEQAVNNQEGSVYHSGDPDSSAESAFSYITPTHFETGEALVDDLPANQVALINLSASVSTFRLWLFVIGQRQILEAPAGEPVTPPAP